MIATPSGWVHKEQSSYQGFFTERLLTEFDDRDRRCTARHHIGLPTFDGAWFLNPSRRLPLGVDFVLSGFGEFPQGFFVLCREAAGLLVDDAQGSDGPPAGSS